MLSRRVSFGAALGAIAVSLHGAAVHAQYYDGCSNCGPVTAAPLVSCTPIQPLPTTCYQTVPVTTYTRERQTVEVPAYETAYEEREVTTYRPVTQTREVEVPTVSYQNVTEYKTVNRDMGRWVTSYHPVAKFAPGQVDPRPGVLGWMNRTGYSMRTAFTPNYTTSRQYVPSMVTCNVPVTRHVAVQSTRRVSVQETKMVAERSTERVPVQKLVMKKQEVTVMRPQTAYRTVPIGTQTAFSPFIGGSQMAFGYPVIESPAPKAALAPEPDPVSAERSTFKSDEEESGEKFRRSTNDGTNIRGSSLQNQTPLRSDEDPVFPSSTKSKSGKSGSVLIPATSRVQSDSGSSDEKATTTRASGWRAARKSPERSISSLSSDRPAISMSDSIREK